MRSQYDAIIQDATERFLHKWDWRWLKAMLFQESGLRPDAKSTVGAEGIAQFMPETWDDVSRLMGYTAFASPFEPKYAIPAAAKYLQWLWGEWTAERPKRDRRRLCFASYNAGLGAILEAQDEAGGNNQYDMIMRRLYLVTGQHAYETIVHVERIERWYDQLRQSDE